MGGAPTRPERIVPGEITVIEMADGACRSSQQDRWFAVRVPAIPAATGPLRVSGVAPGDTLQFEVLALEPKNAASSARLTVAIGVAGSEGNRDRTQAAIPAGGVLHMTAKRPGGLVTFGPVIPAGPISGEGAEAPVAAFATVRVAISPPRG
jgi:acetamidase/formamidase